MWVAFSSFHFTFLFFHFFPSPSLDWLLELVTDGFSFSWPSIYPPCHVDLPTNVLIWFECHVLQNCCKNLHDVSIFCHSVRSLGLNIILMLSVIRHDLLWWAWSEILGLIHFRMNSSIYRNLHMNSSIYRILHLSLLVYVELLLGYVYVIRAICY